MLNVRDFIINSFDILLLYIIKYIAQQFAWTICVSSINNDNI